MIFDSFPKPATSVSASYIFGFGASTCTAFNSIVELSLCFIFSCRIGSQVIDCTKWPLISTCLKFMRWTGKPVTSSLPNQRFHRHSRIQSQIHFPGHFLRVFSMLSTIWVFDKLIKTAKNKEILRNQKLSWSSLKVSAQPVGASGWYILACFRNAFFRSFFSKVLSVIG